MSFRNPKWSVYFIILWLNVPLDSSLQRHLCGRNTPQPHGQWHEPRGGRRDKHHPLSSKILQIWNKLLSSNGNSEWDKAFTLSSNCSKKRSIPFMHVAWFSWVRMTPFGFPLVSLVYIIVQMSRGLGGYGSHGYSFPLCFQLKLFMRTRTKK